jgi:alcohol dehydrogenase YqhD (iron-dependent ADH family)
MQDFTFHNPTRIEFGSSALSKLGEACRPFGKRVMIVLGKGSVRRTGLLDRVLEQLESISLEVVLLEGVRPNPVLSKVEEGIALARENKIDLILAIGGGSVLDSAKAIAAGVCYEGPVWDFFEWKATVKAALPLVTVLTLAATGSEMNGGSVVTREETQSKSVLSSPHCYPRVSFLDPALTLSVSAEQTANGLVDAFIHIMEPYLNHGDTRPLVQRELQEGLVRSLVDSGERLMTNLQDLDARADMMWAATMALNGVSSAGLGPASWPLHMMEHSLSAIMDVAHGAGLSALFKGWATWTLRNDGPSSPLEARLARLGRQVFSVVEPQDDVASQYCLGAVESWFQSIGAPTNLTDAGVDAKLIPAIRDNAAAFSEPWGMPQYTAQAIEAILDQAK